MESEDQSRTQSRNIVMRVLAAFGWLVLVYIGTNMLIGGVVGGLAGSSKENYQAGYAAGHSASVAFFHRYGLLIFIAQVVVFFSLLVSGRLPGTSKYKASKNL